jgi:hypothetical protein
MSHDNTQMERMIDEMVAKNSDYAHVSTSMATPLQILLKMEDADESSPIYKRACDIDAAIRRTVQKSGMTPLKRMSMHELLDFGSDEDFEEKIMIFQRLLEFFYQCGPDPLHLLRHVFGVTKAVRPELLGDMSLEDIAIICADGGRATVSARIQRIYNGTLQKAGMKDVRAPFQKAGNFSTSQLGNQNRKKKPAKMHAKRRPITKTNKS